jgi:hypothetical protein
MDLAKIAGQSAQSDPGEVFPVVVRCYTNVGQVFGGGETITIDAQQIISASLNASSCIARITISTAGQYPQSGSGSINYEDIDRICATLEYLRTVNPNATKFKFMEAIFDLDGVKFTVFNTAEQKVRFSAEAGGTSVFMELSKLDQLVGLLRRTKAIIEQNRI